LPEADSGRAEKVLDEDLRQLVASGDVESVSVIVELDLPRPRVEMDSDGRYETVGRRAQRVVATDEDRRKSGQVVEEVRGFLAQVAGESPVWLSASRAFVVNVTTDQLENIARSRRVRRISQNRLRR
jgi:hypothetical protein